MGADRIGDELRVGVDRVGVKLRVGVDRTGVELRVGVDRTGVELRVGVDRTGVERLPPTRTWAVRSPAARKTVREMSRVKRMMNSDGSMPSRRRCK